MLKLLFQILSISLRSFPSTSFFNKLRGLIFGLFLKGTRKNLKICSSVKIVNPEYISIGDNVIINPETILIASPQGYIQIGNNVLIAPRCYLQTQNHLYINRNALIRNQGSTQRPIVIEDDVWIGYGVIVLQGVRIFEGSVIAAGAVVTKNTEKYSVNAGIPARLIKYRV